MSDDVLWLKPGTPPMQAWVWEVPLFSLPEDDSGRTRDRTQGESSEDDLAAE
jgi:hypothetical protein